MWPVCWHWNSSIWFAENLQVSKDLYSYILHSKYGIYLSCYFAFVKICVFLIKILIFFTLTSLPVVEVDWNRKIISTPVFSSADVSSNSYFINALALQDLVVVCFLWVAFFFFNWTATDALRHVGPYPSELKVWGENNTSVQAARGVTGFSKTLNLAQLLSRTVSLA